MATCKRVETEPSMYYHLKAGDRFMMAGGGPYHIATSTRYRVVNMVTGQEVDVEANTPVIAVERDGFPPPRKYEYHLTLSEMEATKLRGLLYSQRGALSEVYNVLCMVD